MFYFILCHCQGEYWKIPNELLFWPFSILVISESTNNMLEKEGKKGRTRKKNRKTISNTFFRNRFCSCCCCCCCCCCCHFNRIENACWTPSKLAKKVLEKNWFSFTKVQCHVLSKRFFRTKIRNYFFKRR